MQCMPFNEPAAVLNGLCCNLGNARNTAALAWTDWLSTWDPTWCGILHSCSGMACFPAPHCKVSTEHGIVSRGTSTAAVVRLWQLFQRMVAASGATLHRGTAMQLRRAAAEDAYEVQQSTDNATPDWSTTIGPYPVACRLYSSCALTCLLPTLLQLVAML